MQIAERLFVIVYIGMVWIGSRVLHGVWDRKCNREIFLTATCAGGILAARCTA